MLVGLTGSIGSGKSLVAWFFGELGAAVVDSDQAAREAVEPGTPGLAAIVERWGADALDEEGRLDRKKMAGRVFSDEREREALNALLHPHIGRRVMKNAEQARRSGARVVIVEVPLLFETGFDALMDRTVVVTADETARIERIRRRDGIDGEEAKNRTRSQMPQEEKARRATYTIRNDGTIEELKRQVESLWNRLLIGGI